MMLGMGVVPIPPVPSFDSVADAVVTRLVVCALCGSDITGLAEYVEPTKLCATDWTPGRLPGQVTRRVLPCGHDYAEAYR